VHATVCDYITDIVQNAAEAGASRIELRVHTDREKVEITVCDDGKGMDEATLRKALDPFYSEAGKHDHRRVGLGLPLIRQAADALDGAMRVDSVPGKGTTVSFRFSAAHLDTPPLGNLPSTVVGLMTFAGRFELVLRRTTAEDGYEIARSELTEALGDLEQASNLVLARQFIASQEENLR